MDLRDYTKLDKFLKKIDYIINAAAKVGGIYANNKYRADYILSNLQIQNNIIELSHKYRLKSIVLLGPVVFIRNFVNNQLKRIIYLVIN